MAKRHDPSRIRQQIAVLVRQRADLERRLLQHRLPMLDACLIARRQLAGGKLRRTPAYYLSRKVQGKTDLAYVAKNQLSVIRAQTARWKDFSATLARWVKLVGEIERLLRQLGKCHVLKAKDR